MSLTQGTEWTIGLSLLGGATLGLSTALYFALTGCVTGLSGIFDGATSRFTGSEWRLKLSYVGGFIAVASAVALQIPSIYDAPLGSPLPIRYVIAGALVGFGTRLGSGCTSGHGVSGLARFSRRSFASVIMFMTMGAAVALSLSVNNTLLSDTTEWDVVDASIAKVILIGSIVAVIMSMFMAEKGNEVYQILSASVCGGIFALGLAASGMANRSKVLSFLIPQVSTWDPSLMCVMGSAIPIAAVGFHLVNRHGEAFFGPLKTPSRTDIDLPLLIGACMFGAGWGITGMCPGPAVMNASAGIKNVLYLYVPSMLMGMKCSAYVLNVLTRTCANTCTTTHVNGGAVGSGEKTPLL